MLADNTAPHGDWKAGHPLKRRRRAAIFMSQRESGGLTDDTVPAQVPPQSHRSPDVRRSLPARRGQDRTADAGAAGTGATRVPGRLSTWQIQLEYSTPARASIKAHGLIHGVDDQPVARLDTRYEFFKGEALIRVYHTWTWLTQDVAVGACEIAVVLDPVLGGQGTVRVGLSEYANDAWETPWSASTQLVILQSDADSFAARLDGDLAREGERLGGWIQLRGADNRSVSVSLRHAWESYPTAFSVENGRLRVAFWPTQAERLSFTTDAIMGPDVYNDRCWLRYPFSKGKGHFVNNYETTRGFMYTAEGAAWTHELLIAFHDRATAREPAVLNSVTQHPIIIRQDPVSAMRVPCMGFRLMPVNSAWPNIERAVDKLGQMSMAR